MLKLKLIVYYIVCYILYTVILMLLNIKKITYININIYVIFGHIGGLAQMVERSLSM